jgi:hypothetical protein
MLLIKNKKHTVIFNGVLKIEKYNSYTILEYCEITEKKEYVKHPSFKKKILKNYGII